MCFPSCGADLWAAEQNCTEVRQTHDTFRGVSCTHQLTGVDRRRYCQRLGHSSFVLTLTTYADYISLDELAAPKLAGPVRTEKKTLFCSACSESSDTADTPAKPQDYAGLRAELATLINDFSPLINELWPRLEDHKY